MKNDITRCAGENLCRDCMCPDVKDSVTNYVSMQSSAEFMSGKRVFAKGEVAYIKRKVNCNSLGKASNLDSNFGKRHKS